MSNPAEPPNLVAKQTALATAVTAPVAPLPTLDGVIPFQVDRAIVQHLIFNQGSDVSKALMELVMNSIDAGASNIAVTISRTGFRCVDNGRGFQSKEEITRCFETFGTPHEDGDAKYGRFRLGRGQIMAFASTKWQTHEWQMDVDIQADGMGFRLSSLHPPVPGCCIAGTWYRPADPWVVRRTEASFIQEMRYIPTEITINGESIGGGCDGEKWTHEDDDAYYRIDRDSRAFSIYNMGIFVTNRSIDGLGGVIVSKKALALNTSRTSIMVEQCDVWRHITETVAALGAARSVPWTKERRHEAMMKIMTHHPDSIELIRTAPLVSLVGSSGAISIGALLFGGTQRSRQGAVWRFRGYVLASEHNLPAAEAVAGMFPKVAVIHPSVCSMMGIGHRSSDVEQMSLFQAKIQEIHDYIWSHVALRQEVCPRGGYYKAPLIPRTEGDSFEAMDFQSLAGHVDLSARVVKAKDGLKGEALRVWGAFKRPLRQYAEFIRPETSMAILVGKSDTSEAWTDGHTYIAFSTRAIDRLARSPLTEAGHIFQILEHEITHCRHGVAGSSQGVEHDLEFFRDFHDLTLGSAGVRQIYIRKALKSYRSGLRRRKTASLRAVKDKEDLAAGRRPREWFAWERRAAPQIPELCDADAMAYYEILILRMAMARDFDEPLAHDSLDEPQDMLHILQSEAMAVDRQGRVDVDAAIIEAIGTTRMDPDDAVKATAIALATAASRILRVRLGEALRHLAIHRPAVYDGFLAIGGEFTRERVSEMERAAQAEGAPMTRRDSVMAPNSPFRSDWEIHRILSATMREDFFSRRAYSVSDGRTVICKIDSIVGMRWRTIRVMAEALVRSGGTMPPLDAIIRAAGQVLNCIDLRGLVQSLVTEAVSTLDMDDAFAAWEEEQAQEEKQRLEAEGEDL